MPEQFVVDISHLENIGDSVAVEDLDISDKITVYTNLRDMLAVVTAPTVAEIEEEVEEVEEGEEPEVIGEDEEVEE